MNLRPILFAALAAAAFTPASLPAFAADSGMAMPMEAPIKAGDLEISGPFARATLPNAPVGGAYITITNKGTEPDTLVSVASPAAGIVSLHEMSMEGTVMKMRPLPSGVDIAPGATVTMAPSGIHMMFEHLTQPFVEGHKVQVTLTFAKAGSVKITIPVLSIAAKSPMPGMAM